MTRYPVNYLGYVAGYATTPKGALRVINKLNAVVTKMKLIKNGSSKMWVATDWKTGI